MEEYLIIGRKEVFNIIIDYDYEHFWEFIKGKKKPTVLVNMPDESGPHFKKTDVTCLNNTFLKYFLSTYADILFTLRRISTPIKCRTSLFHVFVTNNRPNNKRHQSAILYLLKEFWNISPFPDNPRLPIIFHIFKNFCF